MKTLHKIELEKPYPTEAWVRLFDSSTGSGEKAAIAEAFRRDSSSGQSFISPVLPSYESLRNVPGGIVFATVMVGAYPFGCALYERLNLMGLSDKHVLIGYSSGLRSRDKVFSDGKPMAGKVFIPQSDYGIIRDNAHGKILLADNVMEAGITIQGIANTLVAHFGYSNDNVYQFISHGMLKGLSRYSGFVSRANAREVHTENGICFG